MKRIYLSLFLLIITLQVSAQMIVDLPRNTRSQNIQNNFRSEENPLYWANRPPHPGYWQQDVHYTIKASIDEQTDILTGQEQLQYWNNSPDTLEFVYFHLYQEAFQPESYYDNLQENNKTKPRYGKYERQKLGTEVYTIRVNGQEVKTEKDNTILKVYLPSPLLPNSSVTFNINFKTYFDGGGSVRRRMKLFYPNGYKHYDGVHWYPRISVYDSKFGWTTDQHLGREFYGDFGTFDVELEFNSSFVMDATGTLLNREEVLPADLRQKLDLKNFATKPIGEAPSEIIAYDPSQRKVWKFHAMNVHDFAFTADPTYRIGEAEWNGVKTVALAQESNAAGWQNAAEFAAKVIQVFSEDFGMYEYPKMIVADARDGMEYPMLTLDGGMDPGYRGLLAHEIGHNWFFGMVGTNETYRAFMDEGFTQFLTAWGLERIDGDTVVGTVSDRFYYKWFKEPEIVRETDVYYGYLADAIREDDAPLNTHSDGFGGAIRHGGGYRHVYYKTATMLYNLQYVLGDELFQKAMQHYFHQWKFAHPYPEDFRNSIIDYTKVDLNWFFDQWLETTKNIDYAVKNVDKVEKGEYAVTFLRKGRMQMPIDFVVVDKNDSVHEFHIPNTWFVKETNATVLPRWIGWDKLQPEYHVHLKIPAGIKEVIIDPTNRLADVDIMNNSRYIPVKLSFDHRLYNYPERRAYELFARPDFWWNAYDGLKTGIHLNGNYMNYKHVFNLTAWFNTGLGQTYDEAYSNVFDAISIKGDYTTGLNKFSKNTNLKLGVHILDGLWAGTAGLEKTLPNNRTKVYGFVKSMIRPEVNDDIYALYPSEWPTNRLNNSVNTGITHSYNYRRGLGNLNLHFRSTSLFSDYNYSYVAFTAKNKTILHKFEFGTRVYGRVGSGVVAPESALYLAGGNPEEMVENKFTRARGFVPDEWVLTHGSTTNHFHYGGGLNLRGYAGYLAPVEQNGSLVYTYNGHSGAAVNAELDFDRYFSFIRPRYIRDYIGIDTYLFGDVGIISSWYDANTDLPEFANLRADAGVGTAVTIKKWGPLQKVKPLTIRFDMPLFLNRPPALDPDYTTFRWVVGVSRAF